MALAQSITVATISRLRRNRTNGGFSNAVKAWGDRIGFELADMLTVVMALTPADFYKSMTTHADHTSQIGRPSVFPPVRVGFGDTSLGGGDNGVSCLSDDTQSAVTVNVRELARTLQKPAMLRAFLFSEGGCQGKMETSGCFFGGKPLDLVLKRPPFGSRFSC